MKSEIFTIHRSKVPQCAESANRLIPRQKLTARCFPAPYLGDLDTPVEQQLGANVVLVLVDVVEQAPVRHQLCDQLDGGTQADAQQADQVWVLHAGHDQSLLNETEEHSGMWRRGVKDR